jgi:hypothetical protein
MISRSPLFLFLVVASAAVSGCGGGNLPGAQPIHVVFGDDGGGELDGGPLGGDASESIQPVEDAGADAPREGEAGAAPASLVMFGGMDAEGNLQSQTWIYDGGSWSSLNVRGPSARIEHAMATLSTEAGGEVVLFGGTDGLQTTFGDTWLFDGAGWKQGPSSGPSPRSSHAMASLGKQVVLFGGSDADNTPLSDTWLFDGKSWKKSSADGPPARYWHAMTTSGSNVVLFGGTGESGDLGDTWLFDGTNWSQVLPGKNPSARSTPSMASIHGTAYLFGGYSGLNGDFLQFGDTWRFDGVGWAQVVGAGPSPRSASMAAQNGGLVLFGGATGEGDSLADLQDTWRFDGSHWTNEPTSGPPAADSQAMATQ